MEDNDVKGAGTQLFDNDYFDFLKAHKGDDPSKLRLKFHKDSRPWIPLAINNIAALKKTKKFMTAEGMDYTPRVMPLEVSAQQSTSANVARFHASIAAALLEKETVDSPKEIFRILDMTFGLGMDARMLAELPAFLKTSGSDARVKISVLGFDLQPELVAAANVNFAEYKEAENANNVTVEVREGDSVNFLENYHDEPFDLIFIDPARRGKEGERLYNLHDCQPDITALMPEFQKKTRFVLAKLSPMLDVTQTLRDLPAASALHVVEEDGECKELFAVIDFESVPEEPVIVIDRLVHGCWSSFAFLRSDETALQQTTGNEGITEILPAPGMMLIEPSPATMKAAPFNLLSQKFGIKRLHPNTQLFLGTAPLGHVNGDKGLDASADESVACNYFKPGKEYEILKVWPFSSSNLKNLGKEVPKAEITLRNFFGFTPETLRKRLKIKPGGPLKLFATTVSTASGPERVLILVK